MPPRAGSSGAQQRIDAAFSSVHQPKRGSLGNQPKRSSVVDYAVTGDDEVLDVPLPRNKESVEEKKSFGRRILNNLLLPKSVLSYAAREGCI